MSAPALSAFFCALLATATQLTQAAPSVYHADSDIYAHGASGLHRRDIDDFDDLFKRRNIWIVILIILAVLSCCACWCCCFSSRAVYRVTRSGLQKRSGPKGTKNKNAGPTQA